MNTASAPFSWGFVRGGSRARMMSTGYLQSYRFLDKAHSSPSPLSARYSNLTSCSRLKLLGFLAPGRFAKCEVLSISVHEKFRELACCV
jgi:hypothetical protein